MLINTGKDKKTYNVVHYKIRLQTCTILYLAELPVDFKESEKSSKSSKTLSFFSHG